MHDELNIKAELLKLSNDEDADIKSQMRQAINSYRALSVKRRQIVEAIKKFDAQIREKKEKGESIDDLLAQRKDYVSAAKRLHYAMYDLILEYRQMAEARKTRRDSSKLHKDISEMVENDESSKSYQADELDTATANRPKYKFPTEKEQQEIFEQMKSMTYDDPSDAIERLPSYPEEEIKNRKSLIEELKKDLEVIDPNSEEGKAKRKEIQDKINELQRKASLTKTAAENKFKEILATLLNRKTELTSRRQAIGEEIRQLNELSSGDFARVHKRDRLTRDPQEVAEMRSRQKHYRRLRTNPKEMSGVKQQITRLYEEQKSITDELAQLNVKIGYFELRSKIEEVSSIRTYYLQNKNKLVEEVYTKMRAERDPAKRKQLVDESMRMYNMESELDEELNHLKGDLKMYMMKYKITN